MKENETIAIGWIDGGSVTSGFASYISQIMLHRNNIINGVVVGSGPYLSQNRNTMVQKFLEETTADWLLSLDSDLLIDLESFDALIDSADFDKYGIIGGKYYLPLNNTVFISAQKVHPEIEGGGIFISSDDPDLNKKMIENLHSVGAGYMLVHRNVFIKILENSPNPAPWFADYWVDYPYNGWVSDDIHFCNLATRYGFNIALNTNATSTHLKTSNINDDIYLSVNNYSKYLNEKNYKSDSKKGWTIRRKN